MGTCLEFQKKASVRNCRDHNFCFMAKNLIQKVTVTGLFKLHIVSFPLHLTVLIQCIIQEKLTLHQQVPAGDNIVNIKAVTKEPAYGKRGTEGV